MWKKLRLLFALTVVAVSLVIMSSASAADIADTKYDFIADFFAEMDVVDDQFAKINRMDSIISADVFNDAVVAFFGDERLKVEGGSRAVLLEEAVESFAKGIGYDEPMIESDGYNYKKYITSSQEKALLNYITFDAKAELNARDFMQLLFNAMYIEPVFMNTTGSTEYLDSYAEKKDVERYKGVVTANSTASLYSNGTTGDNSVKIGNVIFHEGNTTVGNYLGRRVEIFVIEDTIISARVTEENNIVELNNEDIENVVDSCISYRDENDRIKRLILNSDYVQVCNGTVKLKKDLDILKNDLSRVTFVSNDENDKDYEVIFIEELAVYRVGSINAEDMIITDERGVWSENFSDMNCTISDGKVQLAFSDIHIGDVIYVGIDTYRSNAVIYVSSESVTGTCTVVNGSDLSCIIDGDEYKVSADVAQNLMTGQDNTFYLGVFGRIEFFDIASVNNYALIYNVYHDIGKDAYFVNMITDEGEDEEFELTNKTKFYGDGISGESLNANMISKLENYIANSMTKNTTSYGYGMAAPIVMFKASEGEIKSISMPSLFDINKYGQNRDPYALQTITDMKEFLYTQSENLYMNNMSGFYPSYRTANYNDGVQKFVDSNTTVFNVVLGDNGLIDRNTIRYTTISKGDTSDFSASWIYANFYNADDRNVADVMVRYDSGREITNYAANLTIVEEVMTAVDASGEDCYLIKGYNDGKAVEYTLNHDAEIYTNFLNGFIDTVPNITPADIGKGDVLSLASDRNGNIAYAAVMHLGSVSADKYNRYHGTGNCESGREVMFGTVIDIAGDTMVLQLDTNANSPNVKRFYVKNFKGADIYKVDTKGDVYVGSGTDILVGDKVYVRLKQSTPMEIVVRY